MTRPEGSQRHLSAESGLYCRVITEGLFGIRPTGLRSFMMNVNLQSGWNGMSLQHIRAFGSDFDLKVFRDSGNGLRITVTEHTASGDKVRMLAPKQGKIFVNLNEYDIQSFGTRGYCPCRHGLLQ